MRYLVLTFVSAALSVAQTTPSTRSRELIMNFSGGASYIGVGLAEVDTDRARQLKLKEEHGVELTHIEEDSPAAKGGLKVHDVVLEYNSQRVEGMEQFARFVRETPAGRDVKLTVSREGAHQNMVIRIGQRKSMDRMVAAMPNLPSMPSMPETPRPFIAWANPRIGIDAEGIEGQLGQFFGVKEGVLIRSVAKGSSAEKAGLRAGDIITKVDGNAVATAGDITRNIRSARSKKTFPMSIVRDRKEMTVTVTIDESQMENQQQGRRRASRVLVCNDGDCQSSGDADDADQQLLPDGFMPDLEQLLKGLPAVVGPAGKVRIIRL